MQNTFANECFIDEIAAAVNADPIEFGVRYTDPTDMRGLEVLDRLVKLANWEKRASPQKNITGNIVKGRGCSYVKYELVRTYIGAVAEVEVNRATGDIRVIKFYIVHDCGQIINPNGVKAQIEGNVIQTVSRTLKEEIVFDRSMVTSLDWATYPILTFPEVPEIEIELIDRPTDTWTFEIGFTGTRAEYREAAGAAETATVLSGRLDERDLQAVGAAAAIGNCRLRGNDGQHCGGAGDDGERARRDLCGETDFEDVNRRQIVKLPELLLRPLD
jgi:hypothetical protein